MTERPGVLACRDEKRIDRNSFKTYISENSISSHELFVVTIKSLPTFAATCRSCKRREGTMANREAGRWRRGQNLAPS